MKAYEKEEKKLFSDSIWNYLRHKEILGIIERNDGFIEAEEP
jgi:hypothetical protein